MNLKLFAVLIAVSFIAFASEADAAQSVDPSGKKKPFNDY